MKLDDDILARLQLSLGRFYLRLCKDAVRAEDLASGFLLKCLGDERLLGEAAGGRLTAYLLRSARNFFLDELRREKRGPRFQPMPLFRSPDGEFQEVEPAADTPSPVEEVVREERFAFVRGALAELDAHDRKAVDLWLDGLDGAEAARMLGISHAAYRKRKGRALERLRRTVGGAACA